MSLAERSGALGPPSDAFPPSVVFPPSVALPSPPSSPSPRRRRASRGRRRPIRSRQRPSCRPPRGDTEVVERVAVGRVVEGVLEGGSLLADRVPAVECLVVGDDIVGAALTGPLPNDRRPGVDQDRGRPELEAVDRADCDRDLVLSRVIVGAVVVVDVVQPAVVLGRYPPEPAARPVAAAAPAAPTLNNPRRLIVVSSALDVISLSPIVCVFKLPIHDAEKRSVRGLGGQPLNRRPGSRRTRLLRYRGPSPRPPRRTGTRR